MQCVRKREGSPIWRDEKRMGDSSPKTWTSVRRYYKHKSQVVEELWGEEETYRRPGKNEGEEPQHAPGIGWGFVRSRRAEGNASFEGQGREVRHDREGGFFPVGTNVGHMSRAKERGDFAKELKNKTIW